MTPTYEELLEGATTWKYEHKGVSYQLTHHGYRKDKDNPYDDFTNHPGIWCYYILIPEQMYPHRWNDFACTRGDHGYQSQGVGFEHDMFDTEITWSSSEPYFCTKTMKMWDGSKVGCDYNHLWHRESGYHDTHDTVKLDAIHTVDKFLKANYDYNIRCKYSGIYDTRENFYESKSGFIHNSQEKEIPEGWVNHKRITINENF